MRVLFCLFAAILVSCETDIERWTTHTYYLENGSDTTIRLLGFSVFGGNLPTVDTIVDTTISSGESIIIVSGYGIGGPTFQTIGAESCDTMKVFKNTTLVIQSWNFLKTSVSVSDTAEKLYQFHNAQVYVPYDTVFFDSDDPQPKEIKYKFLIR